MNRALNYKAKVALYLFIIVASNSSTRENRGNSILVSAADFVNIIVNTTQNTHQFITRLNKYKGIS